MNQNYKEIILMICVLMISMMGHSQIQISITNAQNTNDGSNDYYEADIVIQTTGAQADFFLGSGQLYFNYNTEAFGENAKDQFIVSADYVPGAYILGQDSGGALPADFYKDWVTANNTTSRISFAFSQGVSSGAMNEIIGSTAKSLFHVKFTYVDVNKLPMVALETDEDLVSDSRDQFFTACGPSGTPATSVDCTGEPGTQFTDATMIPTTTNWTGNSNTDWDTVANWSNGLPTADSSVNIPDFTNDPVASGAINVYSMLINSDAALTVNGALNNTEEIGIESGASLIAKTSVSGPIRYHRNLSATDKWYLVSSPVSGETIQDLVANHTLASGTNPNIGLAPYVNNGTAWNYQTLASTGPLTPGVGYSVRLATPGDISFTGSMPTNDVGIVITSNTNNYNLVGNPYPSYIAANNPADGANNILASNSTLLTEQTIWLWNQGTSSYDQVNHTTSFFVAPGQGFFVSSNGGASPFSITETMQSHQTPDSFQRIESVRPEIQLVLSDGATTRDADIFYIDGTTTGFDNGYDSSIFGGVANPFALYTHTVADGQGRDLGIQSLPDNDYENMVIPVGVNATAGTTLTFNANVQNLPADLNVYLEDTQSNTFTQLNLANGEYTLTLDNDMDGIGRFYLRTTSQTLGVNNINLDHISIYTTADNSLLNIEGLNDGQATVLLFDLTGKRILDSRFQSNRFNTVALPSLNAGIYIVKLQSESGSLNKKIIID